MDVALLSFSIFFLLLPLIFHNLSLPFLFLKHKLQNFLACFSEMQIYRGIIFITHFTCRLFKSMTMSTRLHSMKNKDDVLNTIIPFKHV